MSDSFERIFEGQEAELSHTLTAEDLDTFARLTGDVNPLHMDEAFASRTDFRQRVGHGMLTASFISTIIGTRLPGPGAIYVSQELKFLKPVKSGDSISARVEVVEINREKNRIRLRTVCMNQRAEEVLTGDAVVMPPPTPINYVRPAESMGALALWTLQPLAWMAQGATIIGMLGLSAVSAAAPVSRSRPLPK